jgi:hypothetical protein
MEQFAVPKLLVQDKHYSPLRLADDVVDNSLSGHDEVINDSTSKQN